MKTIIIHTTQPGRRPNGTGVRDDAPPALSGVRPVGRLLVLLVAGWLALPDTGHGQIPAIQDNQKFIIDVATANGTVVGDMELEQTAGITLPLDYAILSGNVSNAFALQIPPTNAYVGQLTVANRSALSLTNLFNLQVAVTNTAGGDTNQVTIKIYSPATFLLTDFVVAENSTNGASVGQILVDYATPNVWFEMDTNATSDSQAIEAFEVLPSGAIRVKEGLLLNYETQTNYEFVVKATNLDDPDSDVNFSFGTIKVAVLDLNEPPDFPDQAFALPTDTTETLIGPLRAEDPDQDPVTFQILELRVNDVITANTFFLITNGNQLRLQAAASSGLRAPENSVLTIQVTDSGTPPFSTNAQVTVVGPKGYSRFGIPLLVPIAGHTNGAVPGLPVQALAAGENGQIYVAGLDANKRGYLDIYANGFNGEPGRIQLEANFIPTALAAEADMIYLAGDLGNQAVITRYSAGGQILKRTAFTTLFKITDMLVEDGRLYICGGGHPGGQGLLPFMQPYWAEVDGVNLAVSGSPNFLNPGGWGVATAIAKERSFPNVYVAGNYYYVRSFSCNCSWFFGCCCDTCYRDVVGTFLASYASGSLAHFVPIALDRNLGTFIRDLTVAQSGGSTFVYALEEFRGYDLPRTSFSTTALRGGYSQDVVIRRFTSGLQPTAQNSKLYIHGQGDVKAESLTLAQGDEEAIYVTGVVPGSVETYLGASTTDKTTSVSPSSDRYFVAKFGLDLKASQDWATPLLLSEFNYTPIGGVPYPPLLASQLAAKVPSAQVLYYPAKNGVIVAGNIGSGILTLSQGGNENSVSAPPGRNAGFLTVVTKDKRFDEPVFLEIISEFGLGGIHVLPHLGKQAAVPGTTVTVQVAPILYVRANGSYLGSLAVPPTEQEIEKEAVTRYVNTGYSYADTGTIGDSSSYTFIFRTNTTITFHWRIEHALEIKSDLSGSGAVFNPAAAVWNKNPTNNLGLTSTAGGLPEPEVKKHWIAEDEIVTSTIDGAANDPANYGTRYIVTGYRATGSATGLSNILSSTNLFSAVEQRQQVPQFAMKRPGTITYTWGVQHRVQVSTSNQKAENYPGIKVNDASGQLDRTGTGEFWFERGSDLTIGAQDVDHSLNGALYTTGDLANQIPSKAALNAPFTLGTNTYIGKRVAALSQGTTVAWDYGDPIYRQAVAIGDSVQIIGSLASNVPPVIAVQVNTNKEPRLRVVESPPGTTAPDMGIWDEVALQSYPLRPGRYFLDWEKLGTQVDKDGNPLDFIIFEITSDWPTNSHYRQLVHPEMPKVDLDPDAQDSIAFVELKYTEGDAVMDGSQFLARQNGRTVLLFSRSDTPAARGGAATGDRQHETLYVRVVQTRQWNEGPTGLNTNTPPIPTWIGTKVTSPADTAGISTGFIVHTNARYNPFIYNRALTKDAGPIIPVNRHFLSDPKNDLVIVWSERRDAILWPYQTERFVAQWPQPIPPAALPNPLPDPATMRDTNGVAYLRRIVIASRLGSEGKDHALRNQISFLQDRYDQVTVYDQPVLDKPGYNPNEEHALMAPSFKFLDQATPPPTAYALRNDLNVTNQNATYTSDPFVLVQFLDRGTNGGDGEFKMAVYAIEKEDDRPELNPYRYPEVDPDPADPGDQREFPYTFHYSMKAGEPVQPPYPLGLVIALTPCKQTWGSNISPVRVYWEDFRGFPWAVSEGDFISTFYYPVSDGFWTDPANPNMGPGTCIPFDTAGRVTITGRTPHPTFQAGDRFTLNGSLVIIGGTSPAEFVAAVNTTLGGSVVGAVLGAGEIRLVGVTTNALQLLDGTGGPLAKAGLPHNDQAVLVSPTKAVTYTATWPDPVPILKVGETLTFAGGEYKADNPGPETPGLPGVLGWASGEVIFDSLNPLMSNKRAFSNYTARLIAPLEERTVTLSEANATLLAEAIQPATGITQTEGSRWKFTKLPASLAKRIYYEPFTRKLGMRGLLNDKTLGDSTLTATPPPVYVLEPNILTPREYTTLHGLIDLAAWRNAVDALYAQTRNPNGLRFSSANDADRLAYYVGLEQDVQRDANGDRIEDDQGRTTPLPNTAAPMVAFGPGLALVPSPVALDPHSNFSEGYVTIVENNHRDIGGPVSLFIIKVSKDYRFRGAIKTILSDNVFDERLTLRHSGDFGGNTDDIVYQWYYREEDGTLAPLPPGAPWKMFPDQSDSSIRGLGMYQIHLEGSGGLLLADNLFFVRYRHRNDVPVDGPNASNWAGTEWDRYGRFNQDSQGRTADKVGTHWAGAANSPTVDGDYKPQLAQGWIKRVLDRVNLYEARINEFRNTDAPATYASMILQLGQRYEGPVALNPNKDVIENVGLIELYETVFQRARALSIDLSSPLNTPGINTALLLAATRLSEFYMLLGNEAYFDALDPTIGFGSGSVDYGSQASSMFAFQNQMASLLEEELALLRGVPESYGRPVYTRLFWNFTKSFGEVAYVMNYNLTDQNRDGFVDESDALIQYPQGHGDAWGHYLTAIKSHYRLLNHRYFNWVSRAESYNLLDVVINVDFLDERRFADAAAARAKAGAEIVNLTYRSRYVADPDGQWQGYSDLDADRAWGVDGWARRAGQGAFFDWVTANALIPSEDTNVNHNALQKIDRGTVTAIQNIAAQLGNIQSHYDDANNALNPLGLAGDVVPFDIDPNLNVLEYAVPAVTHFEQIAERAEQALANAQTAWDEANANNSRLRQVDESVGSFRWEVQQQDRAYRNRLIEIFGSPYAGTIGTGQIYPPGYAGPDLMLFMYVDVRDVNDSTVPPASVTFTNWWTGFPQQVLNVDDGAQGRFAQTIKTYFLQDRYATSSGGFDPTKFYSVVDTELFDNGILEVTLPLSAARYCFLPPADGSWGQRASPGELQAIISELVQAQADLSLAVGDYDVLVGAIKDKGELIAAKHGVATETIQIKEVLTGVMIGFNALIGVAEGLAGIFEVAAIFADKTGDFTAEFTPKNLPTGGVAVSPGDAAAPLRGTIKAVGNTAANVLNTLKVVADKTATILGLAKEIAPLFAEIDIDKQNFPYELREQLKELEAMLRNEGTTRIEVFKRLEAMRQISDRYRSALEAGIRLLEERQAFNRHVAGVTQRARYQDMAFRVLRNDTAPRYRAAFDLAARYTYLAAKAYDYDTNLDPNDPGSALGLLTEIVRARTLGGATGLEYALQRLNENFAVLKAQMGLNNYQTEEGRFSLRQELFRIPHDPAQDDEWRRVLKSFRVDDLWAVPEFRRFCRPPAPRSAGPMPGLVIPFATEIVFGRNFFGWPLGAGDHAYDPSLFTTKVEGVGVWFNNYNTANLAATPRLYLVPAGLDIMTIPTSLELKTRSWNIVDQAIPVPHRIGQTQVAEPNWIPSVDSLAGPMAEIRRFSSFRAYGDTGSADEAEFVYNTRLLGRSVWNTRWLLIIPGGTFLANGDDGLDAFIEGARIPGSLSGRDLDGVKDILLFFLTYGYPGN